MGHYSFVVVSRHPVTLADPLVLLGKGVNPFTVQTDDVEALVKQLKAEGVEIREMNCLDNLEAVPLAEGLLLPGEAPDAFLSLPSGSTDE